jgi:hypothetical protein
MPMFSGLTEIIQSLLGTKPFVPFEICFAGEGMLIENPENAKAVDEDGATLAVYDNKTDRTNFINLHAVERVRVRGKRLSW